MPGFNNFYLHFTRSMSFTLCHSVHFYLVFVWLSLSLLLLSLSSNLTAFASHVSSSHVARLGPNIFILLQSR